METEVQALRHELQQAAQGIALATECAQWAELTITIMMAQANNGGQGQSRIIYVAQRALQSVLQYDGKSRYRAFIISYRNWFNLNEINKVKTNEGARDINFQKMTLLASMTGVAVELCQK